MEFPFTPTVVRAGLDPERMPRHIAIIMDGNGRWAAQRGLPRLFGHKQGYGSVKETVKSARKFGVPVLSLYTFSSENWKRPKDETEGLMRLFSEAIQNETRELHQNGVRLQFLGRKDALSPMLQDQMDRSEAITRHNTCLTLNICVNYGGRQEIVDAARRLVDMAERGEITSADVTLESLEAGLYTAGLPDPDLLIRTGGDLRVSNYLLWQIAYAELWVTDTLWPDFSEEQFVAAIADFQGRTRKFGGIVG